MNPWRITGRHDSQLNAQSRGTQGPGDELRVYQFELEKEPRVFRTVRTFGPRVKWKWKTGMIDLCFRAYTESRDSIAQLSAMAFGSKFKYPLGVGRVDINMPSRRLYNPPESPTQNSSGSFPGLWIWSKFGTGVLGIENFRGSGGHD